jgi:hypothetical protein
MDHSFTYQWRELRLLQNEIPFPHSSPLSSRVGRTVVIIFNMGAHHDYVRTPRSSQIDSVYLIESHLYATPFGWAHTGRVTDRVSVG